MERNKLLKLASQVCSLLAAFQIVGIVLATIVLVHWHADKEFYRKVKITPKGGISFQISTTTTTTTTTTTDQSKPVKITTHTKPVENNDGKTTLADLEKAAVYFSYIKGVLLMAFMFLIFREFGSVVRSVRSFQTFREANVQAFQKVGKYLFIIFLLSGIHFMATSTGAETSNANISFDFDTTPLILMLVAYVLAEIFKEGNRLYEEEQLTV